MANVESGMAFLYQGLANLAGLTPEGAAGAQHLAGQAQSEAAADTRKRQREADKKAKRAGIAGTLGGIAGSMIPGVGPAIGATLGTAAGTVAGGGSASDAAQRALMTGATQIGASGLRGAVDAIGGSGQTPVPDSFVSTKDASGAGSIGQTDIGQGGLARRGVQAGVQSAIGQVVQRPGESRGMRQEALEERGRGEGSVAQPRGTSALEPPPGTPAARAWDFLERHEDRIMNAVQALTGPSQMADPVTPHGLLDPQTASAMSGERMQQQQMQQQADFQQQQLAQGDRRIGLEEERVDLTRSAQEFTQNMGEAQLALQEGQFELAQEKFEVDSKLAAEKMQFTREQAQADNYLNHQQLRLQQEMQETRIKLMESQISVNEARSLMQGTQQHVNLAEQQTQLRLSNNPAAMRAMENARKQSVDRAGHFEPESFIQAVRGQASLFDDQTGSMMIASALRMATAEGYSLEIADETERYLREVDPNRDNPNYAESWASLDNLRNWQSRGAATGTPETPTPVSDADIANTFVDQPPSTDALGPPAPPVPTSATSTAAAPVSTSATPSTLTPPQGGGRVGLGYPDLHTGRGRETRRTEAEEWILRNTGVTQ